MSVLMLLFLTLYVVHKIIPFYQVQVEKSLEKALEEDIEIRDAMKKYKISYENKMFTFSREDNRIYFRVGKSTITYRFKKILNQFLP